MLTIASKNLFLDEMSDNQEILALEMRCKSAFCSQAQIILEILIQNPRYLTEALRFVIKQCPSHLDWHIWEAENGSKTLCFEAHGADRCLYNINALTGVILVDGLPPGRLPASILQHALYKRSFGAIDFEVVKKNGMLETVRPSHGRYYRFYQVGNQLFIHESRGTVNIKNGDIWDECFELLDSSSIDNWGKEIPIYLKEVYSH